ncbi:uncharacterized protein Gasu_31530 [Galdieria sulphuraria]|uniref:Uncharacterized protein n=1 Tax=Galdieria sulphuraria TaxID=130081 RepID=M2W1H3_GALSU|nr:uncharacterized protein Gasu_31530 [Galdieria sulphuraria]EME29516.1 hypothetical protein Gasu_31530 [Galdieria sulphuraria]|eukprot:XP_005706036.1 hypothetical protein Gasu_31530 [Galdieria sulphuraria]
MYRLVIVAFLLSCLVGSCLADCDCSCCLSNSGGSPSNGLSRNPPTPTPPPPPQPTCCHISGEVYNFTVHAINDPSVAVDLQLVYFGSNSSSKVLNGPKPCPSNVVATATFAPEEIIYRPTNDFITCHVEGNNSMRCGTNPPGVNPGSCIDGCPVYFNELAFTYFNPWMVQSGIFTYSTEITERFDLVCGTFPVSVTDGSGSFWYQQGSGLHVTYLSLGG